MPPTPLPAVYIFLIWVLFLIIVIAAVMIYRWRRPQRHSRFQLKLTLTLILFLMIPTVPLVFLAGTLIDQARALVVALPLDDALERGLDAVRIALTEEEIRIRAWLARLGTAQSPGRARPAGPPPDFSLRFTADADGLWSLQAVTPGTRMRPGEADSLRAAPPDPRTGHPEILEDTAFNGSERALFLYGTEGVYMGLVASSARDVIDAAGVWIDPDLVHARVAIDSGLQKFGLFTMLGGRGFQEVLWTMASLWLVILAAGAFIITRMLARGVSEPVLELARGMEAVSRGDLTVRARVTARDEMRVLVDSFNEMTDQLREARERIVTAEKQAAWRDVARRIAHEIKNPLTPLQIGLHRIRTRLVNEEIWNADPALQESVKTMNEEVEALRRMAASFSEFAQLPHPDMRTGDLEEVVRGAAALFSEGHRGVALKVDVRGRVPRLLMDADLVKRALINLVKNAVESVETAGGGTVSVELEGDLEETVLSISDNGVGFDPEDAGRLFAPDFTTKARGTGLGLSVVSRIVADHGWHIEAFSEGRDRGATIRIRIPVEGAGGPAGRSGT